jgi:hypothetical protein
MIVVMSVAGIIAAAIPSLVWHGLRTLVFLPKAQVTNQVATDTLHAILEGNFSSVTGQLIRGLRYAARAQSPPEPAIWLAESNRIGFLVPNDPWDSADNQYVVIRLDGGQVKRCVVATNACSPPACLEEEEVIPYYAAASPVQVVASSPIFRYYTQGEAVVSPPGCGSASTIRRVEVAFAAQTGQGNFDEGDARVDVMSSAAIRFP